MVIEQLSVRGEYHQEHNEDACVVAEISDTILVLAVMDGCSMGTESHFASVLISKLIKKSTRGLAYKLFMTKEVETTASYLRLICRDVFEGLAHVQRELQLEVVELLSTLVLAVYDTKQRLVQATAIGDGLIAIGSAYTEFEQGDKPDYIGYHLLEDFDAWYTKLEQTLSVRNVSKIALCTDGIFSFKPFDNGIYPSILPDALVSLFLTEQFSSPSTNDSLKRALDTVEEEYGLRPTDDLTIVKVSTI